ncbi:hypothetical protein DPMN_104661 [Dreissena polymorpha]|uniref:Uncharacterized protein n=1 Tax=Dreissena polymorpha TaxID=45954 RepID=A0A9D4K1U6_DREPO|nr:hypothetical protein DPMN_104661 [Dreissena polymorpha]
MLALLILIRAEFEFFFLQIESRRAYWTTQQNCCYFSMPSLHQFNARPFRLGVLSPHTKTRHVHFKHLVHNSGRNSGCGTPHGCMDLLVFTTRSLLAFLCHHGCIVLWVFTTKSLLSFCVSMDLSCSGCSQHSHDCLSVSAWMYCALCSQQVITAFLCQHWCIVFCVHNQVITAFLSHIDVLCSGCLQPSHYCLSVSAWMYCALGVHSVVITAFLVSAWIYLALGVHSIIITAFLCQHGYILLWVFTA